MLKFICILPVHIFMFLSHRFVSLITHPCMLTVLKLYISPGIFLQLFSLNSVFEFYPCFGIVIRKYLLASELPRFFLTFSFNIFYHFLFIFVGGTGQLRR